MIDYKLISEYELAKLEFDSSTGREDYASEVYGDSDDMVFYNRGNLFVCSDGMTFDVGPASIENLLKAIDSCYHEQKINNEEVLKNVISSLYRGFPRSRNIGKGNLPELVEEFEDLKTVIDDSVRNKNTRIRIFTGMFYRDNAYYLPSFRKKESKILIEIGDKVFFNPKLPSTVDGLCDAYERVCLGEVHSDIWKKDILINTIEALEAWKNN